MSKIEAHPFIRRVPSHLDRGLEFSLLRNKYKTICYLLVSGCFMDFYKRRNFNRLSLSLILVPLAGLGYATCGKSV